MASKDLIEKMKELDLNVNSHMSTLGSDEAETIKQLIDDENEAKITDKGKNKKTKNMKNEKNQNKENDIEETKDNFLEIEDTIIVSDFAEKMSVNPTQV